MLWIGNLLVSQLEARRKTELFLAPQDHQRRLRWKRIHVIYDSAAFHKSWEVQKYLAWWTIRSACATRRKTGRRESGRGGGVAVAGDDYLLSA